MSVELRGLAAAIVAAAFVVGASYGVSGLVTQGQQSETPKSLKTNSGKSSLAGNAPLVHSGLTLYGQYCAMCHGDKAQGGDGPNLHHLGDPDSKVARNIANGFPPAMPAFKNKLNATQLQALTAYVQSLE